MPRTTWGENWREEISTRGQNIQTHHQNPLYCWGAVCFMQRKKHCVNKIWLAWPTSCLLKQKAPRDTTETAIIDYVARALHLQSPCENSENFTHTTHKHWYLYDNFWKRGKLFWSPGRLVLVWNCGCLDEEKTEHLCQCFMELAMCLLTAATITTVAWRLSECREGSCLSLKKLNVLLANYGYST